MKPTTLIELCAAASIATASPAWGCHEQPIYTSHIASDKIGSDIIIDKRPETKISPIGFSDSIYSGYDLLKMDLKAYLSLEDGWDNQDSKAALAETINTAIQFVDILPPGIPLPKPMLSNTGEVGLYWDIGDIYADVNFEEGNSLSIFLRNRRDEEHETFVEFTLSDLPTAQLKSILAPLAAA